jgi:ABC-type transport system substrate-binding protein
MVLCILTYPSITIAQQSTITTGDIQKGPTIDSVVYKYVSTENQTIAFLNNEIDLLLGSYTPVEFGTLDYDRGIGIYAEPGNGYWCIDMKSWRSPLNFSAFRRAFAYAFDKIGVIGAYSWDIISPHDSIIPPASSFCIEEELDWHYYTSQVAIGNQILDDHGFEIDPVTGYRTDPNGNPVWIDIGYYNSQQYFAEPIAIVAVDALSDLHIDADYSPFIPFIPGLYPRCYPDMIIHDASFYGDNIDWLGNDFWEDTSEIHQYPALSNDFDNATFYTYLDDLLSVSSFEEAYDAAVEIQRLIQFEVPRLVVCPKLIIQPYRTDRFTGLVEDLTRGVSGLWSLCTMDMIEDSPSGPIRIGFSHRPRSFNIYTATHSSKPFFENLWPTLFSIGPNLELIPNLATNMISETHADNPEVPNGHIRFTIDIVRNATWSDGVPLTAEDVVFSHTYDLESGTYGNPAAQKLEGLVSITTPIPYRVVVEYNNELYWRYFTQAIRHIIPRHVFSPGGIGYEDWDDWNPFYNPTEINISCGPFLVDNDSVIVEDEDQYISEFKVVRNPNYYYAKLTPPTNGTGTQTPTTPDSLNRFVLGFSSSLIVFVTSFFILNHLKTRIKKE